MNQLPVAYAWLAGVRQKRSAKEILKMRIMNERKIEGERLNPASTVIHEIVNDAWEALSPDDRATLEATTIITTTS